MFECGVWYVAEEGSQFTLLFELAVSDNVYKLGASLLAIRQWRLCGVHMLRSCNQFVFLYLIAHLRITLPWKTMRTQVLWLHFASPPSSKDTTTSSVTEEGG